ncbi:MAG TPA: HlyD family efflux transporter periplasmic adaptor subunit [Azospirillum sp.]|nr:HlyD family efflux transporter periplasmic adaptor subunit [Azospirillum sp.]
MSPRHHLLALAAVLGLALAMPARAHEGHDHGDAPKPVAAAGVPTLETASSAFEVVAVPDGDGLLIYLDRFATNEPVAGATVEVGVDGETAVATEGADGTYRLASARAVQPGSHELTFTVTAGDAADLLIGTLEIPPPAAADGGAGGAAALLARVRADGGLTVGAAMVFLLGALTTLALTGRGRTRAVAAGVLVALAALLAGGAAFAHGGEDHSHGDDGKAAATAPPAGRAAPAAGGVTESPRRLPDGSLYVPKRSQRLLGVRTTVTKVEEATETVPLIGRVAPDPNFGGRVQASQSGRIEPGDKGLPYLGQRVEAGQILAYVVPAVNTVERTSVQQQIAQIDKEIAIAQSRAERLSGLAGSVPQKDIEEARATLDGLRKQRQALVPTLTTREPLRAPVSGVISASNVVVGQFVESREQILFEVLDPGHLLVEATAFDHGVVERMKAATAIVGDGETLPLAFVGHGALLRQQAMPLLFRIGHATHHGHALHVGQPVRVLLHTSTRQTGVVLPRQSVVRGPNGQPQVWEHAAPQRFVARPVRMQPLDGDTVLVSAGLGPEARVVTDGAALLNQVR